MRNFVKIPLKKDRCKNLHKNILNLCNYNPSNMTKFQNIIFLTRLKPIIPLKYRIIQNLFCLHFIVLPYLPLSVANSIKVNNTILFSYPFDLNDFKKKGFLQSICYAYLPS